MLTPGVTPIIGNGVVVDLEVLFNEIAEIEARGKDASALRISASAHIIPSYNRVLDRTTERFLGARQLGTTGRGIGPTYADKMNRVGLRVQDLFDESILRQKVHSALDQKNGLFLKIFNRPAIDPDEVADDLLTYADRVRPMVIDYLFARQELAQEIDKVRPPYNVSVLNSTCALFAQIGRAHV